MIIETPRLPIQNPGEQHMPCVVLIDTSGSMAGHERELEEALREMKETIMEDDIARGRVEVSIITFDDDVKEIVPFGPISAMQIPHLDCGGMTHTHQAIDLALRRVEERKNEYKSMNIVYNQPWIWLFTDGHANDSDNGAYDRLLQAQNNKKCVFYGVGIGNDVDEKELGRLHKKGMILKVSKESFKAAFELLSVSVTAASSHKPGETAQQPIPADVNIKFIDLDM